MDETLYGTRDKRGYWTPNKRPKPLPVFVWPVQPRGFLRSLLSYHLSPMRIFFLAVTLVVWIYLMPSIETLREFSPGWISFILLRNAALALLFYGSFHLVLYIQRRQQAEFKYNSKWPDTNNTSFLFGSQNAENVFWVMCSGVPVWTAYEVFTLWMFANGYLEPVDFRQHPAYLVALPLLLWPAWVGLHFYATHRLIHMGPLYHIIHKVHHNNVNPGPWSGLSMHTFEHVIYFSVVLIYFIVPSHPLLVELGLVGFALGPALGHLGFDRIVTGDKKSMSTENYFHYLHHKYFEVNYGNSDRLIPFDYWFGTAHDGSPEADEAMYKRMKAKKCARG